MVNRYKKYKEPTLEILDQYKEKSLIEVYNNFVKVFSSRGNIRMLADTMQRNMIMKDFKTWLLANKDIFTTYVTSATSAATSAADTSVDTNTTDPSAADTSADATEMSS
jgi:hypothetical protein